MAPKPLIEKVWFQRLLFIVVVSMCWCVVTYAVFVMAKAS